MQATSKSTFYNSQNQNRSKRKHMTSKQQLYENRHTLPVLGQENLKQVLFFSVRGGGRKTERIKGKQKGKKEKKKGEKEGQKKRKTRGKKENKKKRENTEEKNEKTEG